jgi:cobalt-zinc-cadmium efflux system protein
VDILLEATPRDVNMQDVVQGLREIPGIRDVHHLHVWSITSGMYALSAHVDVDDLRVSDTERLAHQAEAFLRERFHINHTTFQFECRSGRTVDEVLSGISVASGEEGKGKNEREP